MRDKRLSAYIQQKNWNLTQISQASRISPARGPPLWDDCDAPVGEGVDVQPDWDMEAQAAPDYEVDQRTNW